MITRDTVAGFLTDTRPEVRQTGLQMLADVAFDAEALLVPAMSDPVANVWRQAGGVLRHRQPWLTLVPSMPRPVPEAALASPWGEAWTRLRAAIRQWVSAEAGPPSLDVLNRWQCLPGTIPDLAEELAATGRPDLARQVAETADLYGILPSREQQILLVPTYRCNLNCSYCYTKKWQDTYPNEMTLEDLATALQWCVDHRIAILIVAGGEATVYRYFPALLQEARRLGLRVSLTSNTLYPQAVQDLITADKVSELIGHYDQGALCGRPEREDRFLANLDAAKRNGVTVFLRYTLNDASGPEEWGRIINVAGQFGIPMINYAFAFRNFAGTNRFVEYPLGEPGNALERQFAAFENDCRARGIGMHLCKPIPLCVFSEANLRKFLLSGSLRAACAAYLRGFSQNLTINPDLSTLACNAIAIRGPKITELGDLDAAGHHGAAVLQRRLFQPYHKRCETCLFHYRGFCQGTCLVERQDRL